MFNSVLIIVYIFVCSTKIQKIIIENLFFSEDINDIDNQLDATITAY